MLYPVLDQCDFVAVCAGSFVMVMVVMMMMLVLDRQPTKQAKQILFFAKNELCEDRADKLSDA